MYSPVKTGQATGSKDSDIPVPADDMKTLKDMGFKDKHIFRAYRQLRKSPVFATQSKGVCSNNDFLVTDRLSRLCTGDLAEGGYVLDLEVVIAWLLEHPIATIEGLCYCCLELGSGRTRAGARVKIVVNFSTTKQIMPVLRRMKIISYFFYHTSFIALSSSLRCRFIMTLADMLFLPTCVAFYK